MNDIQLGKIGVIFEKLPTSGLPFIQAFEHLFLQNL